MAIKFLELKDHYGKRSIWVAPHQVVFVHAHPANPDISELITVNSGHAHTIAMAPADLVKAIEDAAAAMMTEEDTGR